MTYALTSSSLDSGFKVTWRRISDLHAGLTLPTYDVGRHNVFLELFSSEIQKEFESEEKLRQILRIIKVKKREERKYK